MHRNIIIKYTVFTPFLPSSSSVSDLRKLGLALRSPGRSDPPREPLLFLVFRPEMGVVWIPVAAGGLGLSSDPTVASW